MFQASFSTKSDMKVGCWREQRQEGDARVFGVVDGSVQSRK